MVSYRTINRFRVAVGMEELVTLDRLYIDGTKIEANANKYSFIWKKATEKFSAKLQENLRSYFQDEVNPLIKEAILLDEQEAITSEKLQSFPNYLKKS